MVAAMKFFLLLLAAMTTVGISLRAAGSIYDIPLKDIDGQTTSLKPYAGKVLLIVNVASHCGFTKQYAGLEVIHKKYAAQGLMVCGFPCNQFLSQEPGTEAEIKAFCTSKYNVTFPLFSKLEVNGEHRHPLYELLAGPASPFPGNIKWNFTKFLVGRDGKIVARFGSATKPESEDVTKAIEAALSAK